MPEEKKQEFKPGTVLRNEQGPDGYFTITVVGPKAGEEDWQRPSAVRLFCRLDGSVLSIALDVWWSPQDGWTELKPTPTEAPVETHKS